MWDAGIFAGVAKTGWTVLNLIRNWFDAPWKALLISAKIHHHQEDWYEVNFKITNEKPFWVDLTAVRTVKPKRLRLRKTIHPFSSVMVPKSEGTEITGLGTVDSKGARTVPHELMLFVQLPTAKKDFDVTFRIAR
jgi:hypothetical protein